MDCLCATHMTGSLMNFIRTEEKIQSMRKLTKAANVLKSLLHLKNESVLMSGSCMTPNCLFYCLIRFRWEEEDSISVSYALLSVE